MTDTNDSNGTDAKKSRAISKREWLNSAREKVATGAADVAGLRYTNLESGEAVEFMFADNQQLTYQFAAMGGLTKIGNVVNSIVNADDYDGSNPMVAAKEWLEAALGGEWREPGDGPRGPKYDNGLLAETIVAVAGAQAKGDAAHYLFRLESDKKYRAAVLRVPAIMSAYAAEAEKRGLSKPQAKAVDDVL